MTRPAQDHRYQIHLEHCGYITRRYVLRFCGVWVSQHTSRTDAETARDQHNTARLEATK